VLFRPAGAARERRATGRSFDTHWLDEKFPWSPLRESAEAEAAAEGEE
jgi:hypothetical protein